MKKVRKSKLPLQIRCPDGTQVSNTFGADDTLISVFEFLANEEKIPIAYQSSSAKLSMVFPRKAFAAADLERSLRDLNLVPSAALLLQF